MASRWRRWSPAAVDRSAWLLDALESFEPPDLSRDADRVLRDWLLGEALDKHESIATWLLTDEQRLMAYHTLSPTIVELPDGTRSAASRIQFLARDRRHPGVVPRVLEHARRGALKAGNTILAIDPFDNEVAAIWRSYGFHDSATNLSDDSAPVLRQFVDAAATRFGKRRVPQA